MNGLVLPPVPPPVLPVVGGGCFPVHRIYCVGRNYAEHAREMGSDPEREPPFFFTKPADAVHANHQPMPYPPATDHLHHEVEMVVALRKGGSGISPAEAGACVFGHAVGLDMTRRDLQAVAKSKGQPWDMAKGFDCSAPCSAITPVGESGLLSHGSIELWVNGELRQRGDLSDVIWTVEELISRLSHLVRLQPGDLIFTGTPAGVGPVRPGDLLEGHIAGLESLHISIA